MLKHGKSYLVKPLTGESNIYRGGELVGTFAQCGYEVRIAGRCTALAGTELAAHALAEVYLEVEPHSRRWVLTAEEYAEHLRVLDDGRAVLMERYPFTQEESASVEAYREKYGAFEAKGKENVRRQLMNVSPYQYVVWDPNPRRRPSEFPRIDAAPDTLVSAPAMR